MIGLRSTTRGSASNRSSLGIRVETAPAMYENFEWLAARNAAWEPTRA